LLCEDLPVVRSVEDARVALLSRLIDHAPLFPPASLDLPEALEEDRRARAHPAAFMLGRFVCPASGLSELPDVRRGVSVVLDAPLDSGVWLKPDPRGGERPKVTGVWLQPDPGVEVEAIETAALDDLGELPGLAPEVYVEIPLDDALDHRLDEVVSLGLRAKVRCGGSSTPEVEALAGFIRACAKREVVFKATAGLHHAVRRDDDHGFVNLLAAVVFGDEEAALAESDPEAFTLHSSGFSWRGRSALPAELARARRECLHSIGSCSFFEPVEELEELGMLPL
jgi:hypothetical protein